MLSRKFINIKTYCQHFPNNYKNYRKYQAIWEEKVKKQPSFTSGMGKKI